MSYRYEFSNDWYVWVGHMSEGGYVSSLSDGFRMLCCGGEL